MKWLLALSLLISPCYAGQIDYFLKFTDEASGLAALQSFTGQSTWPMDYCVPGIQAWRDSQDNPDGTHNYISGFIVICSFKVERPALTNNAAVQIVVDRDKAKLRQAGAVLKSNFTNIILQDIRFSPIIAGSDEPWGAWQ